MTPSLRGLLLASFLGMLLASAPEVSGALDRVTFSERDTFYQTLTNRSRLPANYPYPEYRLPEGLILWIFNPSPGNWKLETSSNLTDWKLLFYFRFTKTNSISSLNWRLGTPNASAFYRFRSVSNYFDTQYAKWRSFGLTNYTYEYVFGCFCASRVSAKVTAKSGQVVQAVDLTTGASLDPSRFVTIDQLFASSTVVQTSTVPYVQVEFDPVYGFPSRIGGDPVDPNGGEPVTTFAGNLQPLP